MEIKISELKKIIERIFSHLDEDQIASVELPYDYYWVIPRDRRYDNYDEPKEHTMGQLSEDWDSLKKLLNDDAEPISYHFVWLSSILRAIGEEIVK